MNAKAALRQNVREPRRRHACPRDAATSGSTRRAGSARTARVGAAATAMPVKPPADRPPRDLARMARVGRATPAARSTRSNRGEPRVVARPEIDDGATRRRRLLARISAWGLARIARVCEVGRGEADERSRQLPRRAVPRGVGGGRRRRRSGAQNAGSDATYAAEAGEDDSPTECCMPIVARLIKSSRSTAGAWVSRDRSEQGLSSDRLTSASSEAILKSGSPMFGEGVSPLSLEGVSGTDDVLPEGKGT
jgi:hypothetical protein